MFVTKYHGEWKKTSTQEFINEEIRYQRITETGYQTGDKIALITTNSRTEWAIMDLDFPRSE
jgi:long-chain acyl-CoA synthetase